MSVRKPARRRDPKPARPAPAKGGRPFTLTTGGAALVLGLLTVLFFHALVFEGTQGALAANPDVRQVLTVPEGPGFRAHLAFLARLARRYDVALSTMYGDRPTLYAYVAGRWRAGLLMDTRKEAWKRPPLHRWAPFDNWETHTVPMNLALCAFAGIEPRGEMVSAVSKPTNNQSTFA